MFKVGDKVVYPLYGAGTVKAVENKLIDGVKSDYYVLDVPLGNLMITVSVAKSEELGLRSINSSSEVAKIIHDAEPISMSCNWSQRYKDNMEILKSGDLLRIVEVYKTLMMRERIKSLSGAEKKLLTTATHIILTEIILSQDTDRHSAEEMLKRSLLVSA